MTDAHDLIRRGDAVKSLRDWQDSLNKQGMSDTAITIGMAADLVAALPSVGVTVKPLEWFEVEKSRFGGKYTADGYTIRYIEGLWLLDFAGETKNEWRFPNLDAAKAAAQADYAARVLAALDVLDVQPAPDAAQVRAKADYLAMLRKEHAEWSQAQFGDVSAIGPAKHLAKEAIEVAADPTDAIEHADCWMLLWDMQRRAGITDDQLAEAIKTKLAINKARIWPEPKEGEAREHDRALITPPAPSPDVAALESAILDCVIQGSVWSAPSGTPTSDEWRRGVTDARRDIYSAVQDAFAAALARKGGA